MKFASGSDTSGLKQIESSAFDLAAMDRLHDLHGSVAGLRDLVGLNAPDLGDVLARLRIGDRALAGQLIAFLPCSRPPWPLPCR